MWRSSVFLSDYRGGAVVQTFPTIVSLHNWLIYSFVFQPFLACTIIYGTVAADLQQNISFRLDINKGTEYMDEGQTTRMFASYCSNRVTEAWQWTRRSVAHTVEFPPGEGHSSDSNSRLQRRSRAVSAGRFNAATRRALSEAERKNLMTIPSSSACLDVPAWKDPLSPCKTRMWHEQRRENSLSPHKHGKKKRKKEDNFSQDIRIKHQRCN